MAVTRAEIARRAGVSPAVVSYVLNPGSRPVSAGARARIEKAIQETGYRPNAIAQALRRSSTMSIGIMVPELTNPAVAALVRAIEDIAYDQGYVIFVGTVGHDLAREKRYLRTYVDRQVDALIMVGAHSDHLSEVAAQGIPVFVLDSIPHGLGLSSIMPEAIESSAQAVRHLIEAHGHTRIACITGPSGTLGLVDERVAGWRAALTGAGLPVDEELFYRTDDMTRLSGNIAAHALIERASPTAIFTTTDVQAVGAVAAIRERGLFVPSDVAVVSYDGSELAERAFPALTSVDPRIGELAATTMSRLVARLNKSELAETHDVLPASLVIRNSCGCGTAASAA